MKTKSIAMLMLSALLLAMPVAGFGAVYTLTDTTSGVGLGIVYTLDITGSGPSYHISMTVNTINSPAWYIEFWNLKVGDATSASYSSTPSSFWQLTTSSVSLGPNVGQFPQNQRAGGYVVGLAPSLNTLAEVQQGVNLNGLSATWVFDIVSPNLDVDALAFQAGYYSWDARKEEAKFGGRLSQEFAIAEPSTVFLLGSGLLGLVGYGRRKLKK